MLSTGAGLTESTDALGEGEIHDVLRNDRRRLALEALQENGGRASVRDLSEIVAIAETNEDPPPRNKRQSVYVSLHQTHLPKLDELGIVDYDADDKKVELQERMEEIEVYMEVVPRYELSWGEFYFGIGLLGLLSMIATIRGIPVVAELGPAFVGSFLFVVLLISSAYHVYTQQDRIIFQRILQ